MFIIQKAVAVASVSFLIVTLFSNAAAYDLIHLAEYDLDGRIELIQVIGNNPGSGARRNLSICGDGRVEKTALVMQQGSRLTIDDNQSWFTDSGARHNLMVVSTIEVCAQPQVAFTTTRYEPLGGEEDDDTEDEEEIDEDSLYDVVFSVEGNSPLAGVYIQVYSDGAFVTSVGDPVITGANGVAVKRLPAGDYWFKATKAGFQGLEGSFTVNCEEAGEGILDLDFTMIPEDCRKDPLIDEVIQATDLLVGDLLRASMITGTFKDSDTGVAVPGELNWSDDDLIVVESGYFDWVFTPSDCTAYNVIGGVVLVTAKCRPAEKAALMTEIHLAATYLDSVTVSADGKDVPRDEFWVAGPVWEAFSSAREAAQIIYDNECVNQAAVDQAVADLRGARVTFITNLNYGLLPEPVTIARIEAVEVPVKGAAPVKVVAESDQFTGTITWVPADEPFLPETVYTAMIILAPKDGYTLTGVAKNFFAVAGAVSVTNRADSGEVVAVFPVTEAVTYNIGDIGPSGVGIVFYITDEGRHGLEAAPSGWSSGSEDPTKQWQRSNVPTGGTQKTIGSGYANTYIHMAGTNHPAAAICRDYRSEFEGNWFLPSKDELNQMYLHKAIIGGLDTAFYWSSTEVDNFNSWSQSFRTGYQNSSSSKIHSRTYRVRPIRAF
jgi:hypothetical protein